jgi:nitroreductase
MFDLDKAIRERHSTRMFLPRPVPRDLVNEALALAQWSPSNSNIQPWRLVFVSGTARARLKDALFRVADHEAPDIPPLPKAFEHYRYELGAEVYGSMGITIADTARHAAAVMRNFDFFGAPLAALTMVAAYGSFLVAKYFHVSGVLATVTAGLIMANFRLLRGKSFETIGRHRS